MDFNNYQKLASKTESPITPELLARFQEPKTIRLLHAFIGMATEAGELLGMLKKHLFYGKPIDEVNAKEESGNSQWYHALLANTLGVTMENVCIRNIEKLQTRYKDGFTEFEAVESNRNREAERDILEQGVKESEDAILENAISVIVDSMKGATHTLLIGGSGHIHIYNYDGTVSNLTPVTAAAIIRAVAKTPK